jgi:hypothetical protein
MARRRDLGSRGLLALVFPAYVGYAGNTDLVLDASKGS